MLFHFVDNNSQPILGLKTSQNFSLMRGIMKINRCVPDYLQQYTDCFAKIQCLKQKRHVVVDRKVLPVINPFRRIAASLKIKLNEESDRLVKIEIITLMKELTD